MEKEKIGFMAACLRFFGKKSGQTAHEFGAEVSALTDKDKAEMGPALAEALGVELK